MVAQRANRPQEALQKGKSTTKKRRKTEKTFALFASSLLTFRRSNELKFS
jgi:hypothetical protein